jgi:PAS domain S-box-containing protein
MTANQQAGDDEVAGKRELEPRATESPATPAGPQTNILLVDDRPENLTALSAVLEPLGQNLVFAASGLEALRHLLSEDFAVILLDVRMPGMDGFETVSFIKQRERSRDIPIIFLSALSTDASFVFKGYTVGAVDYLSKPFDPHILRSKVSVFVDLYRKNAEIKRQAELLRLSEQREQERALEELKRKNEREYRDLAESMPQIVWMGGRDGRATYYNSRWFEYTGFAKSDREPWPEVLHPEDAEGYQRRWEWAVETGEPCEAEYRLRRASDGCYRWHLSRALPMSDETGEVVSWIGTSTDIDDQKRAEQALRFLTDAGRILASSLDYRETLPAVARTCVPYLGDWCAIEVCVESLPELVAAVHLDPAREAQMADLGNFFPADSWEGCDGKPLVYPPFAGTPSDDPASASVGSPVFGELGVESYMTVPFAARGQVLGAITIGRPSIDPHFEPPDLVLLDTLGRRIAFAVDNAQLYAAAQRERANLEEANRAKDEFLATLSHELRTPLNAMLGWTKLLRTGQLDPEAASRALDTIERNTKAQAQLIEDLLDMSRIIAGKIRLDVRPVDLGIVVAAAVEVVRPALGKGVTLEMALETPCVVRGDMERLQQIVWNLLTNAIKFTPEGGRIDVRLAAVGDRAEISVADTGLGIKAEFLPHVFDRFRQADSSSSRRHGGLGLGLAIVRHLVELHGGSVAVASEGHKRGSTFSIALPLARDADVLEAPATREGESNGAPDLSGLRVVVVDDEPDARDLLKVILENCGAETRVLESARQAFDAIRAEPPDLLLSDIGLPGEDGYWLIRQVRALGANAGGETPAIALTAYASEQDRARALAAGFHEHFAKPVEPEALLAAVAEIARHFRGASG